MKSHPPLILASTSIYRRELLGRLKIPFECRAPGVDETAEVAESALGLVTRLARAKARAVAVQHPRAWVIGSDQVAVLEDATRQRILGKPGSAAACVDQLLACAGRSLDFVTAVALLRGPDVPAAEFVDVTRVTFRPLDRGTIENYVAGESPLDCAGGFKSEGLGIALCSAIDSKDPTGLIGLPLIRLCAALRDVGFVIP